MKALTNASSSRGSYVPQKLKTFLDKTKISSNFGSQRIKDALKKSDIDQKRLTEIFKKAKEEGVLRQTSSTGSEREFYKAAAKEEKSDRQLEQKNQQNTNTNAKESNIAQARKKTDAGDRWRKAMFTGKEAIRGMERIHAGGEEFRKQQAATAGVLKSRGGGGMVAEKKSGSLVGHAEKEEGKGDSSSKGGQKSGGNATASQKSGGNQPPKLQGSADIDELTYPQEAAHENFTGGVYHVEGYKAPASQPETPPVQKSDPVPTPASNDPDELNI